jgi:hypothetical protein
MANDDRAIKIAEISSKFMQEIWLILKEYCNEDATDIDLFACLIATQTVAEAIATRLRNMDVEEDLIEYAIENAKNQVLFTMEEQEGKFYMKGEEV